MTFAVGMSRQPFKQSRVPRNVAAVSVSGTFHTKRPRGLHLDCGRRACQSLNLCSVFSPAIANANWAVMAPRWCQLRMPGHTPSPGNKRPAARICRRHDAAHAQTYATQQIPEDSVIPLRPPFDYACPDIHNPANTGEFRRSPALSIRSRMPRHTPRIRNRHPTDHTHRRHDAAHAQTYATQQIPKDSVTPPRLPPGHACQRIHHLTERFRQYLWLGNARQTDKPLPPRPHYPRPHIRSGAARSTGTAPDRLKRPWIWEWLSVVTQSHVDAADK